MTDILQNATYDSTSFDWDPLNNIGVPVSLVTASPNIPKAFRVKSAETGKIIDFRRSVLWSDMVIYRNEPYIIQIPIVDTL